MVYTFVSPISKVKRFYTGMTNDLRKRLSEHQRELSRVTKGRGPFILVYYEACINAADARSRELYPKSGMGKRYVKNRLRRFLALTG